MTCYTMFNCSCGINMTGYMGRHCQANMKYHHKIIITRRVTEKWHMPPEDNIPHLPKFPFFKHIWPCRDLEHWPTDMTVAFYTLSLCGWHVCTVILKSIYNKRSYRPDTNISPKNFHFLDTFDLAVTLNFDLRIWHWHVTQCLYIGWHFCIVILKFIHN